MTRREAAVPFRTFILKVANRCNIDCDYCFVFNSKDQSARRLPARMGPDVVRAAAERIAEHAEAHGLAAVHVVLHGGEPLLAGVAHVEETLRTVRDAVPAATEVLFEIQTNATLLSEPWLDLFERYGAAVGVSIDGPPAANDRHRLTRHGRSSSAATVRGIELLRTRPHLFAGLLAVVDLENDPVDVHDYLASFEPPVIDFGFPHGTHDDPPHRGDPGRPEYGIWMGRVYDAWLARPDWRHSVRMLEDIVALSSGVRGSVETLGLAPPTSVVIESDGGIEGVDTLRSVAEGASLLRARRLRGLLRHRRPQPFPAAPRAAGHVRAGRAVPELRPRGRVRRRLSAAPVQLCTRIPEPVRLLCGPGVSHPARPEFSATARLDAGRPRAGRRLIPNERSHDPMTATIRPAEKSDVPALAALIEEIERFYGTPEAGIQPLDERLAQVEEALFGSPPLAAALVVEDGAGSLAGLAAYSFLWPSAGSSHSLFLKELYVRESLRRQGIGVRLMQEIRAIGRARPGCTRVEWTTDRFNGDARSFYRSLGFEEYDGKVFYREETGTP
ncbi:cyclophane-containing RiPP N-acetyltransferase HaaN [Streptomyces griseoluteus]|uniref:cyclophane-containing RiPP N-acetyltransferase HaaN n=1 Tax=Streptomyces griseoluteus TaxID=29306 RepID=UPI0033298F11